MKRKLTDLLRTPTLKGEKKNEVLDSVFGPPGEYNRFYSRAGIAYRVSGFVFLFLFLFYLIVTLLGNLGSITYENAEYIVRNFADRYGDNADDATEMIYDPDSSMRFALFGRGLAVCGNTGVTVFSATGRKTCRDVVQLAVPAVKASSKYVVAYDSGGVDYYVYNSFSRVYTGKTDRPLYAFSVADNGSYLYLTESDKYASEAVLCDSDFNVSAVYGKNEEAVCAAISADGSKFAEITLGLTPAGHYSATLYVYPFAGTVEISKTVFEDSLPLDVAFSEDGLCVLCADCVLRFEENGQLIRRDGFSGEIRFASLSYSSCAVITRRRSGVETEDSIFLSAAGRPALAATVPEGSVSLFASGYGAYLLCRDGIRYFDGMLSAPVETGRKLKDGDSVAAYAENRLYYITRSAAYPLVFSAD